MTVTIPIFSKKPQNPTEMRNLQVMDLNSITAENETLINQPEIIGYIAIDQNLFKWTDYIAEIPVSRGFSAYFVETQTGKV